MRLKRKPTTSLLQRKMQALATAEERWGAVGIIMGRKSIKPTS